jgi:ribosomal protein S18 acetylase RimI-like enzyme
MIRLANPGDCSAIETIVRRAYEPYIARIGRKPGPLLDDYSALVSQKRVRVLVSDGGIKGILVTVLEDRTMLLDNIAVDPDAQGRGYGRTLLEFAEEAALASGCESIRLYTNEAMTENIALYSRIGYVETHRAEEKGLRRVYMSKRLVDFA